MMSRKNSCQSCIFLLLYSRFYQKSENWLFFNQVNNYAHFLKNISILNQKTSTSARVGLFHDIKSLFQKSVDKKLQIFTFIFYPVLLHFFIFFIMILFHSAISFDHKKNYKISLIADKVMVT